MTSLELEMKVKAYKKAGKDPHKAAMVLQKAIDRGTREFGVLVNIEGRTYKTSDLLAVLNWPEDKINYVK